MIVDEVRGDLMSAVGPIVQICNRYTTYGHGLSKAIEVRLGVSPYPLRRKMGGARNCAVPEDRPEMGTIDVLVPTKETRVTKVICIYGQSLPGPPYKWAARYPEGPDDSPRARLAAFKQGLRAIEALGIEEVAAPHRIGCGLAKGSWPEYEEALRESKLRVTIYRL